MGLLHAVLMNPSQDFEPYYQCLEATNIIGYTDGDMSSMISHRIRTDTVKLLGFRLGYGSAVVLQQHADVMSQLISSLGVTLALCHE